MLYREPRCGDPPESVTLEEFKLHDAYPQFSYNQSRFAPYIVEWREDDKFDIVNSLCRFIHSSMGVRVEVEPIDTYNFHTTYCMIDTSQYLMTLNGSISARSRINRFHETETRKILLSFMVDIEFRGLHLIPPIDRNYDYGIVWESIAVKPRQSLIPEMVAVPSF